jgi:hypothetical protein
MLISCLLTAPFFGPGVLVAAPYAPTQSVAWVAFESQVTPVRRTSANAAVYASGADETLIYSNTEGKVLFSLSHNSIRADDITFVAQDGCKLRRFRFRVTGKLVPDGAGGPFQVQYGLYPVCPNASPSTPAVVGTTGTVDLTEDSVIHEIEHVVPLDVDVELFPTIYLGLRSNRTNVGVVGGAPALVGFSVDKFDTPIFPCNSSAGGFPTNPHASYFAEVFGDSTCQDSYPAYMNQQPGGSGFSNSGARRCFAEDVQLNTAACEVIGLDIGVRVAPGAVGGTIQVRLHENAGGLPGAIIGPFRQASVVGDGLHAVHFSFDPPVPLNTDQVWVSFQSTSSSVGWVVTRQQADVGGILSGVPAYIGTSNTFARSASGKTCTQTDDWVLTTSDQVGLPFFYHIGFDLTIHCVGQAPSGACCDMMLVDEVGDSVCREVPRINCPFPGAALGREERMSALWVEGKTCFPEPFAHLCGTAACCIEDQHCRNLTKHECDESAPDGAIHNWVRGTFCGENEQHCYFGDCGRARAGPDCGSFSCSSVVCRQDAWCCDIQWDEVCLRKAVVRCSATARNSLCSGSIIESAMALSSNDSVVFSNAWPLQFSDYRLFSCQPEELTIPQRQSKWFRFIATQTTARIDTCNTFPPRRSIIAVYEPTNPDLACGTLEEIACAFESDMCDGGLSALELVGLVPGTPYFIQVAPVTVAEGGIIRLDISSPPPFLREPVQPTTLVTEGARRPVWQPLPAGTKAVAPDSSASIPIEAMHREQPDDPPRPRPESAPASTMISCAPWVRDEYASVQVNVDKQGCNIPGDAANEPSIAVDSNNPNRIAIGWRQFDSVESNFRQAGYGYTEDAGRSWTFPGVLEEGVFRSDPVLDADGEGCFYYYSLDGSFTYSLFRSLDGGKTWPEKTFAFGGDKGWMAIDKTGGQGHGNIYATWTGSQNFTRSSDGGFSFMSPIGLESLMRWGTIAVGRDGEVYVAGLGKVVKSINARNPDAIPTFGPSSATGIGASYGGLPNPDGLTGQVWIAADTSEGPYRGYVYVLGSGRSLRFTRSTDGGLSWDPIKGIGAPLGDNDWQWFGTMSVAPNGRIDVVWNDTRNGGQANLSELFYTFSSDGGDTWAKEVPVSPMFDSWVGWPNQDKLGDYYDMVSDDTGVHVAYAATFNGEQDVYYLRIGPLPDCNENGIPNLCDVRCDAPGCEKYENCGMSEDCDGNGVPDECERDWDGDGLIDACDPDSDSDGIPDELDRCPYSPVGSLILDDGGPMFDSNKRCSTDLDDYWRFRNCMLGGRPGMPAPHEACMVTFDANGDGAVDLIDYQLFANTFTGRN